MVRGCVWLSTVVFLAGTSSMSTSIRQHYLVPHPIPCHSNPHLHVPTCLCFAGAPFLCIPHPTSRTRLVACVLLHIVLHLYCLLTHIYCCQTERTQGGHQGTAARARTRGRCSHARCPTRLHARARHPPPVPGPRHPAAGAGAPRSCWWSHDAMGYCMVSWLYLSIKRSPKQASHSWVHVCPDISHL